jgi:hypothetical protein
VPGLAYPRFSDPGAVGRIEGPPVQRHRATCLRPAPVQSEPELAEDACRVAGPELLATRALAAWGNGRGVRCRSNLVPESLEHRWLPGRAEGREGVLTYVAASVVALAAGKQAVPEVHGVVAAVTGHSKGVGREPHALQRARALQACGVDRRGVLHDGREIRSG